MKQENELYSRTSVSIHQATSDGQMQELLGRPRQQTVYQELEEEQHALLDTLPQCVWLIRPAGSVASMNQCWRDESRLLSQSSREQEGLQVQQFDDVSGVQDRSKRNTERS